MAVLVSPPLFFLCFIAHKSALLFHGDNIPGQATTTIGPLGKDATLFLLVQEVLELKARVKSQEIEIQTLKVKQISIDNGTASSVNKLMSEYIDINTSFGVIKQKLEQNNNQTGLLALKSRLDNIAQSIRYLTLSLQGHEIQDEETNKTTYRKFEHLNTKLVNELQVLHEEILNLTNVKSADIHQLEAVQQTKLRSLESEIATQIAKLSNTILHLPDYSKYIMYLKNFRLIYRLLLGRLFLFSMFD